MAEGEIERGSQGISAWGALIMAVGMSTLWITVGAMVIESSRDGDFLNLYTGATLAWEGRFVQTHDPDVQFAKEKTLYLDLLQRDDLKELSPGLEVMVNVHAITANLLQESMVLSSVLVAVVVGLALVSDWQAPLWHWVAASLTGCILVPPHAYPYDASILLLAVLLVMFVSKDRYSRLAAATLAVPLPFFAHVGGGLWRMTPAVVILLLLVALARENYLEARAARAS